MVNYPFIFLHITGDGADLVTSDMTEESVMNGVKHDLVVLAAVPKEFGVYRWDFCDPGLIWNFG